jgi:hypothetical protein
MADRVKVSLKREQTALPAVLALILEHLLDLVEMVEMAVMALFSVKRGLMAQMGLIPIQAPQVVQEVSEVLLDHL